MHGGILITEQYDKEYIIYATAIILELGRCYSIKLLRQMPLQYGALITYMFDLSPRCTRIHICNIDKIAFAHRSFFDFVHEYIIYICTVHIYDATHFTLLLDCYDG